MKQWIKPLIKLGFILFTTTAIASVVNHKSSFSNANFIKNQSINFSHTQIEKNNLDLTIKGYSEQQLKQKIDHILFEIKSVFQTKVNNPNFKYPANKNDQINQAITYLLSKIVDKSQKNFGYSNLFQKLKNIINYNFQNKKFYQQINLKNNSDLIYKKYLEQEKSLENVSTNKVVINTLSDQEIKDIVDNFLNNWKNYLIDHSLKNKTQNFSSNHFGFSWYDQIPDSLKPVLKYNSVFTYQDYQNMIDAIVTNRENSKIISNQALFDQQDKVEQKLQAQLKHDQTFLKEKTENNQDSLFIDRAPDNLAKILAKLSNQNPDDFNFKKIWNLYYSRIDDIKLNLKHFADQSNQIRLISKEIVEPTTNNDSFKLNWKLSLNNAFLSNQSNLGYQLNVLNSTKNIFDLIFSAIEKNPNQFIKLSLNAINNFKQHLSFSNEDFIVDDLLYYFFKDRKIDLKIINLTENDFPERTNINQYKLNLVASLQLKNKSLKSTSYSFSTKNFIYTINPDLEQRLLNSAPHLRPILNLKNRSINDVLGQDAIKNQLLNYNNDQSIFKYQPIWIVAGDPNSLDPKLEITTLITLNHKFATNKSVIYFTSINLNEFSKNLSNFDQLALNLTKQIIAKEKLDDNLSSSNLNDIYQKALTKTKSDPDFHNRSVNQNLKIFSENYHDLIKQSHKLTPESIKSYQDYQQLKNRLEKQLIKAGINLKSKFAQGLFNQINQTQEESLTNPNATLKPEFLDLIDFINRSENNLNTFKALTSLIEKYSPEEINLALSQTQKNLSYAFVGISSLILLTSIGIIIRGLKIDQQKFQLKKPIIITIGMILLIISISGLSYLLTILY
ncbi:hypothetical protein MCAV_07420 [[Mycoplasma] cavipharyngis]|uniref:hypothetical protein n=1 Tax=[Mycoplasma] cavipharyngis TaxID=92757 RepID=UPI003703EA92